jgi:hypothetical protein
MKSALTASDLKIAVTKSLGRQHLLGAVPAAQRFLPLAAFAVSDVLSQRYDVNLIEKLMVGDTGKDAAINLPQVDQLCGETAGPKSTLPETCLTCFRSLTGRGLHPANSGEDLSIKKPWAYGGSLCLPYGKLTPQESQRAEIRP